MDSAPTLVPLEGEFDFQPEQVQLRDSLRKFCERQVTIDAVREAGFSPTRDLDVWQQLVQMGIPGLGVPESSGGSGGSAVEAAVAFEELGRALYWGPTCGTVAVSVPLLVELSGAAPMAELLSRAVGGDVTVTLLEEAGGCFPSQELTCERDDTGQWRLTAAYAQVIDGDADVLLVSDPGASDESIFVVYRDSPGVTTERLSTLDATRVQSSVRLRDAPAERIAMPGLAAASQRAHAFAAVLLAAESLGVAQFTFESAVAHAKSRYQFGRPIGSFQAIKHRLAEMYVELENVRSVVYHAAWQLGAGGGDEKLLGSMAKAAATELAVDTTAQCLQIFGGMGFTWEHHAHLYYKRAMANALVLGTAEEHWEQVACSAVDVLRY